MDTYKFINILKYVLFYIKKKLIFDIIEILNTHTYTL